MRQHGPVHPARRRPEVAIAFAHRGARAERPENTIVAFARALELGASGLESDAWLTADGQVVLDHDGVTGPWWRRQPIARLPRAALPGHIPTLAELFEACGHDFELSLDVKDPVALGPILAGADAAGARERLWLCYPDWHALAGWRPAAGRVRLVESTRVQGMTDGLEAHALALQAAGVDALNLHRRDWNAHRVACVHRAGLLAFAWDAQSGADINRLLAWGMDGVYSDHVDRLVAAVAGRSP
jgi:glycerophosphoryl diester phosphodiesterase